MKIKCFFILFFIFISSSIVNNIIAQTDSIRSSSSFDIIKDTIKTTNSPLAGFKVKTKDTIQKESLKFTIGTSIVNKSQWAQPYRFENKELKTLSVRITIANINDKKETFDYNHLSLLIDDKKLRVRPTGLFYYKSEKKIYLRSRPLNKNYNVFEDHIIDGYQNFEEKTYKVNFLGLKKKKNLPSVKTLKKITIKNVKIGYYVDFPVDETFIHGKIYYKDKSIGFAAVK